MGCSATAARRGRWSGTKPGRGGIFLADAALEGAPAAVTIAHAPTLAGFLAAALVCSADLAAALTAALSPTLAAPTLAAALAAPLSAALAATLTDAITTALAQAAPLARRRSAATATPGGSEGGCAATPLTSRGWPPSPPCSLLPPLPPPPQPRPRRLVIAALHAPQPPSLPTSDTAVAFAASLTAAALTPALAAALAAAALAAALASPISAALAPFSFSCGESPSGLLRQGPHGAVPEPRDHTRPWRNLPVRRSLPRSRRRRPRRDPYVAVAPAAALSI